MSESLDPISLSALQHWCYCPRQCGLIHLEQAFDENLHTLRGQALHARVDQPGLEVSKGLRIERALPLWHDGLGLIGKADVVEFNRDGTPYPVEYKHGSRHKAAEIALCDDIQLAAQAMCLEEMIQRPVAEGAIFYASSKRRREVQINSSLRAMVVEIANAIRRMLKGASLPPVLAPDLATKRCRNCSLRDRCQPEASAHDMSLLRARLFDPDV